MVARRLADAIAAADLLGRQLEALDDRTAILKVQLRMAEREKSELALRDAQASEAARRGVERATSRVTIRVGGDGPVGALELSYFVTAARWWPRYTLRLTDGGRAGTLALEALVAQLTAEDWTGVKLSLSTADYLFDTQLPELASLRLGRAQQPRSRSFRAAPEGLDRLFEGYDRAFPSAPRRSVASTVGGPPPAPPAEAGDDAEELEGMLAEATADMDMKADDGDSMRRRSAPSAPSAKKAAFGGMVASRPSPAPMRAMAPPASVPMEMAASMPPGAPPRPKGSLGGGGADLRREPEPPPEPAWDDGAWQDFGRLALQAPTEGGRGRLTQTRGPAPQQRARLAPAIERLAAPRARDPRQSRGSFDHRHEAAGSCDLPADGLVHRLTLGQAGVQPSLVFRTVPREDPSVFREAELRNPFDAPLLDGPVDIYVEGSLVTTSDLPRVDCGGQLRVGLGVEERIRVIRNGFAEEESAGLLGGSRSVSHKVVIEAARRLSTPRCPSRSWIACPCPTTRRWK